MRIAFYAPLKSPDHLVPSGDRSMARLLREALEAGGHQVRLASELRSLERRGDAAAQKTIEARADAERAALLKSYRDQTPPDLWFTYHHYYKAPDFLGPILAGKWGIPYVVAEASHAPKRLDGPWANWAAYVEGTLRRAACILAMTHFDRTCLAPLAGPGCLVDFPPFLKAGRFLTTPRVARKPGEPCHLLSVAMMRDGDKLESYTRLARALLLVKAENWHLTLAGDGPARPQVEAAFSRFPQSRLTFTGRVESEDLPALYAQADLFLWPGAGEAYGMVYLEAAASGLATIAQSIRGVPDVVIDGQTGRLTPDGDDGRYAQAIEEMLADPERLAEIGQLARKFIVEHRDLPKAAERLNALLGKLEDRL